MFDVAKEIVVVLGFLVLSVVINILKTSQVRGRERKLIF